MPQAVKLFSRIVLNWKTVFRNPFNHSLTGPRDMAACCPPPQSPPGSSTLSPFRARFWWGSSFGWRAPLVLVGVNLQQTEKGTTHTTWCLVELLLTYGPSFGLTGDSPAKGPLPGYQEDMAVCLSTTTGLVSRGNPFSPEVKTEVNLQQVRDWGSHECSCRFAHP